MPIIIERMRMTFSSVLVNSSTVLIFTDQMCNVFSSYTTYFYVLTKSGCRIKPAVAHNELIIKEKGLLFVKQPSQNFGESTGVREEVKLLVDLICARFFCPERSDMCHLDFRSCLPQIVIPLQV